MSVYISSCNGWTDLFAIPAQNKKLVYVIATPTPTRGKWQYTVLMCILLGFLWRIGINDTRTVQEGEEPHRPVGVTADRWLHDGKCAQRLPGSSAGRDGGLKHEWVAFDLHMCQGAACGFLLWRVQIWGCAVHGAECLKITVLQSVLEQSRL